MANGGKTSKKRFWKEAEPVLQGLVNLGLAMCLAGLVFEFVAFLIMSWQKR